MSLSTRIIIITLAIALMMSSSISTLQTIAKESLIKKNCFNRLSPYKSPLKVKTSYSFKIGQNISQEIKGNFTCINKTDKNINKIFLVIYITNSIGQPLWKKQFKIGSLLPGASTKKLHFEFLNPTGINISNENLKYSISYDKE